MKNQTKIIIACLFLTPLMCLGLDLYTPSLPAITNYFHVTALSAKLTIVFYLVGFAIAQPFVGIIADHIERKSMILIALIIYCASSILSAFSPTIHVLYYFRIINSICAACTSASIRIMIAENFSGKMLAKMNNYYVMGWSLTPILAPVLGGYLQHYFDWQASFYFMGLYAFIALVSCAYLLNKKLPSPKTETVLKKTINTWKKLFCDRLYIANVIILSVENSLLFLYYATAPFIIQTILHFDAAQYGKIVLFIGVSYMTGSFLNGKLLNYFSTQKLIGAGLIASLVVAFAFVCSVLFFHWNAHPNIYAATIPIFIIFMLDGFVFANAISQIVERYTTVAGTASGLMSGLLNIAAAIVVFLCSALLNLHYLLVLSAVYFVLLFCSICVFRFLK
ncbi:MAG TPA: multidrug effflux MFS transporter [Coxiellaceae bacterium]|nr:MAG: hypothetical protein A3E81_00765 [Gammaproteobacteria bacterium RIFCSPHIGHO2_12_FULL_36_30]HLB56691.1 multidrug effflux MFS transporter [Coxiellaceae bacterium]